MKHRIPREAANSARKKLPTRQKLFAAEYAIDLNATRAAKSAGYAESSAHVTGSQLIRNPKVAVEIERRLEQKFEGLEITADYVLGVVKEQLEKCRAGDDPYAVFKGAELLGRHKKLWTDKAQIENGDSGPLQVQVNFVKPEGSNQ